MSPKYIVSHLDQQLGPFEESDLKAKWEKGDLLPIDYVYVEGKQDWILMSEQFAWAKTAPGTPTPPPLAEITVKKTLPPEPPTDARTPVAVQLIVPTVAPAVASAPAGARVELKDGVGEVDLSPFEPGNVELVLQSSAGVDLKLLEPLKIQIKPSEPQRIEWTCAAQQTVGVETEIHLRALDQSGNICARYTDHFSVRMSGDVNEELPVHLRDGKASLKLTHTKAEICKLTLHYTGTKALKLPEAHTLEWHPGAATKLILDGPQEYLAGYPLKVHVKAVDNFGNLAKTFQGTIVLEVKAS